MTSYEDGEAERWRRRNGRQTDEAEKAQRRVRELAYYEDEEEVDIPRRKYEDHDDVHQRRRYNHQRTDDSFKTIRRHDSEGAYDQDEDDLDIPRRRGSRSKSNAEFEGKSRVAPAIRRPPEDESDRRPRSPSISRRRHYDYYRAPYFDDYYESDDLRSPSPSRVNGKRFAGARSRSISSRDSSRSPPPSQFRSKDRDVSPSAYRPPRIRPEWVPEVPERSNSRSAYSSSGEETVESVFPKKGSTRIPVGIVSKRAIIELGYPFEDEGDAIIIQKALGPENIDELFKLSQEYGVNRRLNFQIPLGMDGDPLNFSVSLVSQATDEKGTGWNNVSMGPAAQPLETLSLDESRSYTDESGVEKIVLTLESIGGSNRSSKLRWIHIKEEHMSIKSLEHLVTRIPRLESDDILIALHLLRRVAEKAEKSYVHGRHLEPMVLRGDSRSVGNKNHPQPDRHCTFINFPYFSLQAPSSLPQQNSSHLHKTPGLLQTMYPLESTKIRDEEQAICKLHPDRFGKANIHVPQMWSIVIGSGKCLDMLITYSTHSLSCMRGERIEVQKSMSKRSGPSVLRVTDPYQRVFFFSLEQCKTWFELEEIVYSQCELGSRQYAKWEFDIFSKSGERVGGATWPTVLASEESPFIDIFVHFKVLDSDYSDDSRSDMDNSQSMVRRPNMRYHSGRRESIRDPWYKRAGQPRPTIRARVARGATKDSRHSTRRSQGSRSRLRTGTESIPAGLPSEPIHAVHENRKAKLDQDQRQETQAAPEIRVAAADGLAATNEEVDHTTIFINPGERYDGGGEKERALEQSESAEKDRFERHPTDTLNIAEATPNLTRNNSQNLDSSNSLSYIEEADERIVAEPESYIPIVRSERRQSSTRENSMALISHDQRTHLPLPVLQRRRSSYVRGDSMALVPFKERHFSINNVRPLDARENARPYHFIPRQAPQTRRTSTLGSNYETSHVRPRRLPEPRRRGLLMDNHHESRLGRRQTLEIRRDYEERRFMDAYSRKGTNKESYTAVRSSSRPDRHIRGRPAPDGIVINATLDDNLEPDIYYTPKKTGESTLIIKTPVNRDHASTRLSSTGAASNAEYLDRNDSIPSRAESNRLSKDSAETSHKERLRGSFQSSRLVPPIKSSVHPILMWPTGPAADLESIQDGDSNGDSLVDEKGFGHPQGPPRTRKLTPVSQNRSNDLSMQEILERIYNSLLTDESNSHDRLFREMERAQLKDAIYKLPEQQPANENREGSNLSNDEVLAGKSKYDPAEGFLKTEPTSPPKAASGGTAEYRTKLLQFSNTANELLEFFIPADYSNDVIRRYYGSVKRILNNIDRFQRHNEISRLYTNQGGVWIIEDIGDDLEKHHLRPLSKPLDGCSKCKGRFSYKNDIDPSNHLLNDHFEADRQPRAGDVHLWIKKYHPLSDRRRCEQHFQILKSCCNHLNVIHKGVQEIRDGVRTVGTDHNPRYRLPKALVESFRKIVLLLVYTSHVIDIVTERSKSWTDPDWKPRDDSELLDEVLHLKSIGHAIEETVDKGKLDLTFMIRTQDYTQSIRRHEAVGPQYILAMVLDNLQRGVNCNDLLGVYKEYIARLSFQVSQYPRRRLLRSLKYVEEEISSTVNSMHAQNDVLIDYRKVLNPQSFRTTTEARVSLFDLEFNLIEQGRHRLFQQKAEFLQLQKQVQRLIEATKTSVEINDDDHGKAILVFTVVTLVFLPLSFVTSFLGMNTVDIRNQNTTQSLFWIVALPITSFVVVVALIIGYKYEVMREWVEEFNRKLKKE